MNHLERFRAVANFQPVDRLPRWEWASWWDKTVQRWLGEGLPANLNHEKKLELFEHFGLDPYVQLWLYTPYDGTVTSLDDYRPIASEPDPGLVQRIESMRPFGAAQARGEAVFWATLDGFFWFPRRIMGIEPHLLALTEKPELIHRINRDLAELHVNVVHKLASVCVPAFLTIAEDMSFNLGPMLSKKTFDDLVAPYYRRLIPVLREYGIVPVVDTDGNPKEMISWLRDVGVAGILPLERNAGVDASVLRENYPDLVMIGHYDKMVMNRGEPAMRAEFERLLPLMKKGGFIPSVDHQTPPGVSLAEYRIYLRLLEEYTAKV